MARGRDRRWRGAGVRGDLWEIVLPPEPCVVALEVCGFNQDSYWLLKQPSFVQAEVVIGIDVVAATGVRSEPGCVAFTALAITERVQRVQRYSMQRVASEAYRLAPGWDAWRSDARWPGIAAAIETTPPVALIARGVPHASYATRAPLRLAAVGELARQRPPAEPLRMWWQRLMGHALSGWRQDELETDPLNELQAKPTTRIARTDAPIAAPLALADHGFAVIDLGDNRSGFLGARVRCSDACRFVIAFDELITDDGDVDWLRGGCVNAIEWRLEPGFYELETLEPYTARYCKLMAIDGACVVETVTLRSYENAEAGRAHFACADPRVGRVFAAARATFAQNAVDVFTDCPSRERAGWLCDSLFTARAALDFCGNPAVERAFLENFVIARAFPGLPDGMLPMCFPADHAFDGNFIPNWAMFFVIELEEYLGRSGDRALIDAAAPRVRKLIEYLSGFANSDGLLERLPKWVFVEWSKANDFVQDVNYPSNMLWAGTLDAAARLYGDRAMAERAAQVRATVRAQSFDGRFFVDNALRVDGRLARTTNRTEVCQYFAFWFGVADVARDGELWRTLVEDFGPRRRVTGKHPEIHPANAFIGNYVRLDLLSRAGLGRQVLAESLGYFLGMAERTGTLWEHDSPSASCNHGFASHIAHAYFRDVLGLAAIDRPNRRLTVRLHAHDLAWCEGQVPIGGDVIDLAWRRSATTVHYRLRVPAGWTVTIDNRTGGPLAAE